MSTWFLLALFAVIPECPPHPVSCPEHRPIAAVELSRGGRLPAERRFELSSGDLSCRAVLLLCVSALQPR